MGKQYVKMRTTYAGPAGAHQEGDVVEFDDAQAKELIDGGYAEPHPLPVRRSAAETAVRPDPSTVDPNPAPTLKVKGPLPERYYQNPGSALPPNATEADVDQEKAAAYAHPRAPAALAEASAVVTPPENPGDFERPPLQPEGVTPAEAAGTKSSAGKAPAPAPLARPIHPEAPDRVEPKK